MEHTKGPWEVIEHNWSDTSIMCGDKTICKNSIYYEATETTQEQLENEVTANFKLIKASPNMYEALLKCKQLFDSELMPTEKQCEEYSKMCGEIIQKAIL